MTYHDKTAPTVEAVATARVTGRALADAASALNGVVERQNTIPILGYVRVTIAIDGLSLRATNLALELNLKLDAETTGTGSFMLGMRQLSGLARAAQGDVDISILPPDPVSATGLRTIRVVTDGITLRTPDRLEVEDFPVMAIGEQAWAEGAATLTLSQAQVARMIGLARHCISKEETRYYLNGIHLCRKPDGTTLRAVATDGHRLARIDSDVDAPEGFGGCIVPAQTVKLIAALTDPASNEAIAAQVGQTHGRFAWGNVEILTKMIDGTFPDYTRVVPTEPETGRVQLSSGVMRRLWTIGQTLGAGQSLPCAFDIDEGTMTATGPEGDKVEAPLTATGTGRIGFNLRYLSDLARAVPDLTIQTITPNGPVRCVGDDPDALFVLMPMRV